MWGLAGRGEQCIATGHYVRALGVPSSIGIEVKLWATHTRGWMSGLQYGNAEGHTEGYALGDVAADPAQPMCVCVLWTWVPFARSYIDSLSELNWV